MGQHAVEVDQGDLALTVDLLEVALDHDGAPAAQVVHGVIDRRGPGGGVGGGVSPGAAPTRGDGRLDDEVAMGREAGVNLVLGVSGLGLQPHRRDHGDPPLAEPGEVVLVRVPGDDVGVIGEPGH